VFEPGVLDLGHHPFNKNFQSEVQKFLGGKWIATGSEGVIPFHSQNKFRSHLNWRMLESCCWF